MANWFSARILLAGFILLLAILLVVLVVGNIRRSKTEAVLNVVRPDKDLAMQKINYTETQDGRRKWSVQADSAAHDFATNIAVIRNVRMVIYDQEGGDIVVSAEDGRFDMNNGIVYLSGNVNLGNVGGRSVRAEELEYIDAEDLIRSDKAVSIVADGIRLSGVGFVYDLERGSLRILSSVEATFKGALNLP